MQQKYEALQSSPPCDHAQSEKISRKKDHDAHIKLSSSFAAHSSVEHEARQYISQQVNLELKIYQEQQNITKLEKETKATESKKKALAKKRKELDARPQVGIQAAPGPGNNNTLTAKEKAELDPELKELKEANKAVDFEQAKIKKAREQAYADLKKLKSQKDALVLKFSDNTDSAQIERYKLLGETWDLQLKDIEDKLEALDTTTPQAVRKLHESVKAFIMLRRDSSKNDHETLLKKNGLASIEIIEATPVIEEVAPPNRVTRNVQCLTSGSDKKKCVPRDDASKFTCFAMRPEWTHAKDVEPQEMPKWKALVNGIEQELQSEIQSKIADDISRDTGDLGPNAYPTKIAWLSFNSVLQKSISCPATDLEAQRQLMDVC